MKRNKFVRFLGFVLMVIGVIVIVTSITVNTFQYLTKQEAISSFNEAGSWEKIEDTKDIVSSEGENSEEEAPTFDSKINYLVRIPKIDSVEPVSEGTSKEALANSLGHDTSTVNPGEKGNCVIAGHRNYTFGKFFNRLDEVEIGDMIYVDTHEETYTYKVKEIKVVEPEDVSILDNTEEEILTLYTCTPIYIATHRLVVIAERVE